MKGKSDERLREVIKYEEHKRKTCSCIRSDKRELVSEIYCKHENNDKVMDEQQGKGNENEYG